MAKVKLLCTEATCIESVNGVCRLVADTKSLIKLHEKRCANRGVPLFDDEDPKGRELDTIVIDDIYAEKPKIRKYRDGKEVKT